MPGDEEYLDVAYNPSEEKIYFTGYDGMVYSSDQRRYVGLDPIVASGAHGPVGVDYLNNKVYWVQYNAGNYFICMRTWMGRLHCQYCQTEIMRLLVWMCTLNRMQYTLLRAMLFTEWH